MGSSTALTAGVIGLGEIGAGVARALVRAGTGLVVCDVRPEACAPFADVATVADGPAQLAAASQVILVAVVDDAQVLAVLDPTSGALSTAGPGCSVVVLSTVSPDTVRTLAELAAACGVDVADCGVSGGTRAAAEGSLVAMVGGDESVVERIRPVLDAFSSLVVHMGPLGAGLQAKLARNLVQYGSWLAAYEAQLLAEAAGIELSKLARVIRESDKKIGGASTLMFRPSAMPFGPDDDAGLVGAMRRGSELAHKDLQAALELGRRLGVALPLAAMTEARADALFGLAPDPVSGS
jgi:3-hydroxyisobutyrate dehydrogenase-like beta-hydroxyacid dehydrogenase